jgi:hypothetical protein
MSNRHDQVTAPSRPDGAGGRFCGQPPYTLSRVGHALSSSWQEYGRWETKSHKEDRRFLEHLCKSSYAPYRCQSSLRGACHHEKGGSGERLYGTRDTETRWSCSPGSRASAYFADNCNLSALGVVAYPYFAPATMSPLCCCTGNVTDRARIATAGFRLGSP